MCLRRWWRDQMLCETITCSGEDEFLDVEAC